MLTKDFYGKNGFVWWTGVVENDVDPLELGSVQVRIIGLHSEDKSKVKTEDLPWAQVVRSPNTSWSTSVPRVSEWVFGFFQDGDYAQIPVVVGVFPGIESVQSTTIYSESVIKKGSRRVPRPSQVNRILGEPSTPRMARGVLDGTLTNSLNDRLSHICDVKMPIEAAIQWAKATNSQAIKGIVDQIKLFATGLGDDPSGIMSMIMNALKWVQTLLREIQKVLKEINSWLSTFTKYAALARALIDYINGLPAKAYQYFKECLTKITAGIISTITALFSTEEFSLGDSGFTDLKNELDKTLNDASKVGVELAKTVSVPGQVISALVNPSSEQSQKEALNSMNKIVGEISANGEAINNQTMFKKNNNIP